MSNFDNLLQPSRLDLGWQAGAYVSSILDYTSTAVDQGVPEMQLAWFMKKQVEDVPLKNLETQETNDAIKWQIENKIINKWGYPYGAPMPKHLREQIRLHEEKLAKDAAHEKQKLKRIAAVEKDQKYKTLVAKNTDTTILTDDDHKADKQLLDDLMKFTTTRV